MRFILIIAALLAIAAPALAAPVINLGDEPAQGTETVRLKELWRAGGEDDDVFFGNVVQAVGGPDGKTYVLDVQLVQIFVFDAGGEFLGTYGQQGEGPGEVNNTNCMFVQPGGGMGLGQVMPGKVALIAADGTPGSLLRITDPHQAEGGLVLAMESQADESSMLLAVMRWSMTDQGMLVQEMALRSYGLDGVPGAEFYSKSSAFNATYFEFDELKHDFVWHRYALLPDGRVALSPERNDYAVRICGADGTLERTLTRDYQSVRRNADQREQARMTTEAIGSHYGRQLMGVTIEETEPDIHRLWASPEGLLWARTSDGDADPEAGVLTAVDVLDPAGKYVARKRLVCPGDPSRDGIHFLPGGRVLVVLGAKEAYRREVDSTTAESQGGEEVVLELICYGPG